jgi:YrbI family 3-deoxy-D-manno-octulosonate 8-phosphate phosphatase
MTDSPRHVLAVIPARGGSKGIPRKNVRLVAGEPLLAFVVREACRSRRLTRVTVSTDDDEVAIVARRYGAEVIRRPAEISDDTATSESALLHALEHLRSTEGYEPDLLVFLQCTSPLTLAEDIDGTIDVLLDTGADTALAVAPFHYFLWRGPADQASGVNHDKLVRPRRQDREPQYVEAGAVVVARAPAFLKAQQRFYGRSAIYEIPEERCLEIDEPSDLLLAEARLRDRLQRDPADALPDVPAALVLDFDGVFTDNRVVVTDDGREGVICHRGDGLGLARLRAMGLPMIVLSTETNPLVALRCQKLGVPCEQGLEDKAAALAQWIEARQVDASEVVYVGNDINDLECLKMVGAPVVVADAVEEVKPAARLVLDAPGGQGAVREICDLIQARLAYAGIHAQ